jgi:hypothetical protein
MCRNVRSIEWHQKTHHEISWDYPFKQLNNHHVCIAVQGRRLLILANFMSTLQIKTLI